MNKRVASFFIFFLPMFFFLLLYLTYTFFPQLEWVTVSIGWCFLVIVILLTVYLMRGD